MEFKAIPEFDHIKFISKISIVDGNCWNWTGNVNTKGYPRFWTKKLCIYAHRLSYSLFNGELFNTMAIDHVCKNTKCVNPDHLRQVSIGLNIIENSNSLQALNKNKTHCINGHEFTPENTKYVKSRNNNRACRRCLCDNVIRYNKRNMER